MYFGCVTNSYVMDSICIPATVDSIGLTIFGGSSQSLAAIRVLAVNPPAVGGEFFASGDIGKYGTVRLYVPGESLQSYKTHEYWGKFVNIIGVKESAVTEITDESEPEISEIYTMDGIRLHELQKGINIVVMTDGKVRKIIVNR